MKPLESSAELGPVAKKVVRAIAAAQKARVVDLRAFREGTARAAELQTTVASRDDLADYHPAHAAYICVQNQVSVLSEQLTALPETRKFAQRIAAAEDEYQPSGPPMSPLTTSYFTCWAFFDASVGLRRETLGTCILALGRTIGMDAAFLALVRKMQRSRMGVYAYEGVDDSLDEIVVLRDLVTGTRMRCVSPSGWTGTPGELWLARVLPPPVATSDVSVVFTTPYVLHGTTEADWIAYFARTFGSANGDAAKTDAALKFGIDWSEYIFAGYEGHTSQAVFLTGLPDVPSSLPHYSPRGR